MPTHSSIVFANQELLNDLGIPLVDADKICWSCGYRYHSAKPERAHIIAVKHGGTDEPKNIMCLCTSCHRAQPDGASREYQIAWLKAEKTQEYNMANAVDIFEADFETMAGVPLRRLLELLIDEYGTQGMLNIFNRVIREGKSGKAGVSYVNGRANAIAALVELYRDLTKDAA